MKKTFRKTLTANDVGATGGHQAGVHIPKKELELLDMLPSLPPEVKNPDAWILCIDDAGNELKFRYIYYNNKLHDEKGTRNEYRVTHMMKWFKDVGASAGDEFEISREEESDQFSIRLLKKERAAATNDEGAVRIRLTNWRRVH